MEENVEYVEIIGKIQNHVHMKEEVDMVRVLLDEDIQLVR